MHSSFGKNIRNTIIVIVTAVIMLAAVFAVYVSQYYRADETALRALESDEAVAVKQTASGWLFDGPADEKALVFYPGGKVEETAYAPLLHEIAARGMDAFLVKMPLRLAFLDTDAADDIIYDNEYEKWYIGGHSLGGVAAANYAAASDHNISGLVLLAAYPSQKLPDDITEITVVGSEDGMVSSEDIKKARRFAPEDYREYTIEGGNHSQFGSYGRQMGDGEALITAEKQIRETVAVIDDSCCG